MAAQTTASEYNAYIDAEAKKLLETYKAQVRGQYSLTSRYPARFDEIDTDGNGTISRAEFEAMMAREGTPLRIPNLPVGTASTSVNLEAELLLKKYRSGHTSPQVTLSPRSRPY